MLIAQTWAPWASNVWVWIPWLVIIGSAISGLVAFILLVILTEPRQYG